MITGMSNASPTKSGLVAKGSWPQKTVVAVGVLAACTLIVATVLLRFLLFYNDLLSRGMLYGSLVLITPAFVCVLSPGRLWQLLFLVVGAFLPLWGLACLWLYGDIGYLGGGRSPEYIAYDGLGAWFVVIGVMTWRHSRLAASVILVGGFRILLGALMYAPGVRNQANLRSVLDSLNSGVLFDIGWYAVAIWAGWITCRLLFPCRK